VVEVVVVYQVSIGDYVVAAEVAPFEEIEGT
jgi:hypothetical protein